ncbi:MAG: imidazole glycerol phosphate synthase subunit HisH [Gloeomargarita sp. SKYG116]|nr:imidazole glycerol phosphate synthase subunit HisH [Gloeomargarita sp. SKYG116]MCS7225738.1 imidazole glycerol phosphate synthase subunit HisH [Gloeomargarita sp. SKYB31]MDW8401563.1 imidazole glycerol phosphate synthase subunit HisH [Gloeomargarita sp. SKYGB_i_bin116]
MRLGVIDYDMGNLHSVLKALAYLGVPAEVTASITDDYSALILPGVGAFDPAIQRLRQRDLITPLQNWIRQDRPFLGICLGLQLLFTTSAEGQELGLNVIPGHVQELRPAPGYPVPHMGWNQLHFTQSDCPLWKDIPTPAWVYFVHSYHAVPADPNTLIATVEYGGECVTAAVARGNCWATQFHPEKSGAVGLKILSNWLKYGVIKKNAALT